MKIPRGAKIKFAREKQRFTVQASSERFTICTKPVNKIIRLGGKKYTHKKTYLYTIIDWQENRRGPNNLILGSFYPYNTKKGALKNLQELEAGEYEVSSRRDVPLDVVQIETKNDLVLI